MTRMTIPTLPDLAVDAEFARIATLHGIVKVPARPKRIVALGFLEASALLDIGITPVGKPGYMPDFAPYTDRLKGLADVTDAAGDPDLEKIAALRPDLILADDVADPSQQTLPYAQLTKLAPTAVFEWKTAGGNWRQIAASVAGAAGDASDVTALRNKYLTRAAAVKKKYARVFESTRWSVIDAGSANGWGLYGTTAAQCIVMALAGVRFGATGTTTDGIKVESLENLDILADSDAIVISPGGLARLKDQAAFRQLPAVRSGRVFTSSLFLTAGYDMALGLIDDVERIARTLGKDHS